MDETGGVETEEFITSDWLHWRVAEWRAQRYLLVLRAQRAIEAGDLERREVLEAFGWSRATWFRYLAEARWAAREPTTPVL